MLRIVAGKHRGRKLTPLEGGNVRPTAGRAREAIFNILAHAAFAPRPVYEDAIVLDAFAGSGALGLEALSRGAAACTFVESDRGACRTINANLDKLGLEAIVLCQDVLRALARERGTFDLVLCDPPYGFDGHDRLAPQLVRVLAPDGLLVYESSGRAEPPDVPGLAARTSRKYGSARLTLFTR